MIQRNLLLKEPIVFEKDISKGTELVAVQLHNDSDEMKPELFRYRKDRWPHGCFISDSESLFKDCCDCTDGCTDKTKCACLKLTLKAKSRTNASKASALELYMYKRLFRPVPSGIYECSPWCSCDQRRCQNRVVQHGLRVRLQVFKTKQRGWGVRCLDDIDEGTFVCTYAGTRVIRHGAGDLLPSSNKRRRDEQPSDDDVEVVEEKKNPQEKRKGPEGLTASYSLDENGRKVLRQVQCEDVKKLHCWSLGEDSHDEVTGKKAQCNHETEKEQPVEDNFYYLDATEEGNVGRFLNHSCSPNLFVQNVFVDSHDKNYPIIAFFTNRHVKAGTELTWNYMYKPGSCLKEEVPCHCGSDKCQKTLI
ncbi:SETB2 methyltransferase, partial [Amia calva]|nr:SETB2 methyltransferase [Amia calva]